MPLNSERSKKIEAAIHQPSAESEVRKAPVIIGGQKKMLEVYRLPISLLTYNIRNGRFAAELMARERELGRKLNPLQPQDHAEIQALLLNLDPGATELLKRDLRAVGQTDPGIITHDGHVINGNRRMAILSQLHKEDGTGKYEYLEVQRLPPDISERDLWRIEAGLQLSRDKRLEYGPVNDLLKIREGINAGLKYDEIAATLYGIDGGKEVQEKEKRLALIDSYLDYIGEPGTYLRANGLVEHFINVQDFLRWLDRQDVKPRERHNWLLRAFEMIRAELPHVELRKLRSIYESERAHKHFLTAIVPMSGKRSADVQDEVSATVKEQFEVARDYQELEQDAKRPQSILSKATRAMEALLKHKRAVASDTSLHVDVSAILRMAEELVAECEKGRARRKSPK